MDKWALFKAISSAASIHGGRKGRKEGGVVGGQTRRQGGLQNPSGKGEGMDPLAS